MFAKPTCHFPLGCLSLFFLVGGGAGNHFGSLGLLFLFFLLCLLAFESGSWGAFLFHQALFSSVLKLLYEFFLVLFGHRIVVNNRFLQLFELINEHFFLNNTGLFSSINFDLSKELLQVDSEHLEQVNLEPLELPLPELEPFLVKSVFPLCVVRVRINPLKALTALDWKVVCALDELWVRKVDFQRLEQQLSVVKCLDLLVVDCCRLVVQKPLCVKVHLLQNLLLSVYMLRVTLLVNVTLKMVFMVWFPWPWA